MPVVDHLWMQDSHMNLVQRKNRHRHRHRHLGGRVLLIDWESKNRILRFRGPKTGQSKRSKNYIYIIIRIIIIKILKGSNKLYSREDYHHQDYYYYDVFNNNNNNPDDH